MVSGRVSALCLICPGDFSNNAQRVGTLASGTRLRARPPAIVLDRENVAVERRDPLLTLHRHLEIAQRIADIFLDLAPVELRVAIDHIRGAMIAEHFIYPVLDEFMV